MRRQAIRAFYNALPDNYKSWDYVKKIPELLKSIEDKKKIKTSKGLPYNASTSPDSAITTFGPSKL